LWKHKRFDHKFPTQYYKNDGNFKTVESFSNVIDLAAAKRTFLCYFIINLLDNIIKQKLIKEYVWINRKFLTLAFGKVGEKNGGKD
jgi:hypothetical protein